MIMLSFNGSYYGLHDGKIGPSISAYQQPGAHVIVHPNIGTDSQLDFSQR